MARKQIGIDIDLDTRKAQKSVKDLNRSLGDTEDGLEDTRSAGQKLAAALQRQADDMIDEIDATKKAVDALDRALGPDFDADTRDVVADLKRVGLTAEDIEQDADELAAAIKRAGDVDMKATEAGFRDIEQVSGRAADSTDNIRRKGEGLQSAIPAIRGFGDELGGTSYAAGIASQAVADLGDFALIAGEKFAAEGSRMAGVATKLGTVLGMAGLAGAFAGIAVQLGQTVIPKIQDWISGSEEATRSQEELTEAIEGVADALLARDFQAAVRTWLDNNDEMVRKAADLGIEVGDLTQYVFGLNDSLGASDYALENNADKVAALTDEANTMRREIGAQVVQLARQKDATELTSDALIAATESGTGWMRTIRETTDATEENEEATTDVAAAFRDAAEAQQEAEDAAWGLIDANLAHKSSLLDIESGWEDLTESGQEAWDKAVEGAEDAEEANRNFERSQIAQKNRVLEFIQTLEGVPPEQATELLALIDEGDYAAAERRLNALAAGRTVAFRAQVFGAEFARDQLIRVGQPNVRGATGGIVNRPTVALIGEAGPEAVVPLDKTPGNGPLPAGGIGGGGNTYVTVNVHGGDPERVIQAIRTYERRNGPGWRS